METDREILKDGETLALRMGLPALALRLRAAADRQQAALDRLTRERDKTRADRPRLLTPCCLGCRHTVNKGQEQTT